MPKDICFSGAGCRVMDCPAKSFNGQGDPNWVRGWEMPFAASVIQNTS